LKGDLSSRVSSTTSFPGTSSPSLADDIEDNFNPPTTTSTSRSPYNAMATGLPTHPAAVGGSSSSLPLPGQSSVAPNDSCSVEGALFDE
jgi:hypothetical protein